LAGRGILRPAARLVLAILRVAGLHLAGQLAGLVFEAALLGGRVLQVGRGRGGLQLFFELALPLDQFLELLIERPQAVDVFLHLLAAIGLGQQDGQQLIDALADG
jgi:hypothetical protein